MTQPSRRQFLRLGAFAVVAAGPVVAAERAAAALTPAHLLRRTYRPLVGSTFRFVAGRTRHTATLVSVGNVRNGRTGDPNRFRLVFSVRGGRPPQGTYRFQHPRLPSFLLFVVPVGNGGRHYEAVVVSA